MKKHVGVRRVVSPTIRRAAMLSQFVPLLKTTMNQPRCSSMFSPPASNDLFILTAKARHVESDVPVSAVGPCCETVQK